MSPEEIQLSHVTCSSAVMWTWTLWMINLGKACVTFKHISQLKSVASRPVWIGAERLVDWRHALVRRSKRSGLKERWGLSRLKVSEGLWTVVSARWRTAGARRGGAAVWKPHDSNENNPDYKSCFPLGFFLYPSLEQEQGGNKMCVLVSEQRWPDFLCLHTACIYPPAISWLPVRRGISSSDTRLLIWMLIRCVLLSGGHKSTV